jgi:NAD-dependent dihydropyrimidine dehydrogenase PreA subunit
MVDECGSTTADTIPVVDHGRCEAKRDCVRVCPNDVFEVRRIDPDDFARLGILGKVRNRVYRGMTAYVAHPDQCNACGLCVTACPEHAISLVPR